MPLLSSSSFHIIQQAQIDSKNFPHISTNNNVHTHKHPYISTDHISPSSHIVILTHIDIYINSSHPNPGTMSAPKPSGGTTSSKAKNPGPQPVGANGPKTYPEASGNRGDKEAVSRVGIVTQLKSKPNNFRVTAGGGDNSPFPIATATTELDILNSYGRNLAVGQKYTISFQRPKGSLSTIPYAFGGAAFLSNS